MEYYKTALQIYMDDLWKCDAEWKLLTAEGLDSINADFKICKMKQYIIKKQKDMW